MIIKIVFGLRKVLESDDFSQGFFGGVGCGSEERHGLVEFLRESRFLVVLEVVIREDGGRFGGLIAKSEEIWQVFAKPSSASSGEGMVNFGFIEREIVDGLLVVDGTGVHFFNEFHNGDRERCVAV